MGRVSPSIVDIETRHGPARVVQDHPEGDALSLLVLGHGAGGDVDAPDLVAVRDVAVAIGVSVARITQPYRLAGRRAPAPARQLDEAWVTVVTSLLRRWPAQVPALVVGGRSSGARVACRTARELGAAGVLALAFPLHPPGRPERTRAGELATGLPTLVLNGDRDPFGVPSDGPGLEVCVRPGERHDLRRDPDGTAWLAARWLRGHGWAR